MITFGFGLIHGFALAIDHGWKVLGLRNLPYPVGWALTMGVVISGLVVFRAPDLSTAATILAAMWGLPQALPEIGQAGRVVVEFAPAVTLIAVFAAIVLLAPNTQQIMDRYWMTTDSEPEETPDREPILLDDSLRDSVRANLEAHERLEIPLDGRRHAAVAVLLVDSALGSDEEDPHPWEDADMSKVPPSPDAFAYSDKDLCRKSLASAGFEVIEINEVPSCYHGYADGFWSEFLQFSVRTPIIMDRQTPEVARAIEADVAKAIGEFETQGKIAIPMPSFVVSGKKPS